MNEEQMKLFTECYKQADNFISKHLSHMPYKAHERHLEIIALSEVFYRIAKEKL